MAALLLFLLLLLAGPAAAADGSSAPAQLGETPLFTAGPLEYRPGRGLRVGDSGVVVGGFTTVKAESAVETGGEFTLDNLNVFLIFDRFTRFRAVAELEFNDIFVANEEGTGGQDFSFIVRRLFGEYTIADELKVRAGTFLTPIGYWNLILAPPLTWTTESPLIVEGTFFQSTTTGLMVHGSSGVQRGQLGYALFSQFLNPIEDNPDVPPPNLTAGARLTYDFAQAWSLGASYQAAENNDDWSQFGGLDVLWEAERGQILSEIYFQDGEARGAAQWGTYLQGVFDVYGPFHLVGRYEHYDQPAFLPTLNLFTLGAVFRPYPFMAIKAEYRFCDRNLEEDDPEGFFASFATFF